jgi:tetratricopeptide (TPR) repeat protein
METDINYANLRAAGLSAEALAALDSSDLPHSPQILALRAQLLNDLGRFDEALEAAVQAITADPAQRDAWFAQGFALYMLERWPEAERTLDTLVELEPGYPNAAWLRAGLLARLHDPQDPAVLAAYDLTLAVDPANLYARVERADVLRANGRYEEALAAYLAVRAAAPEEPLLVEATFKQGCVALVLQNIDAARASFRTVLDYAPDYPEAQEMYRLVTSSPQPPESPSDLD